MQLKLRRSTICYIKLRLMKSISKAYQAIWVRHVILVPKESSYIAIMFTETALSIEK